MFALIEIILRILHVVDGFYVGETNHSKTDDIITQIKNIYDNFYVYNINKICKFRSAILDTTSCKHNFLNLKKTPVANFRK